MINIVTALHSEAKPIITHYGLKRDLSHQKFEIFKNDSILLIISGIGKLKSAIATTYLLGQSKNMKDTLIFNIGICGSNDINLPIGTLIYINKITDHESKKKYYPDVLLKHGLPESSILTFDRGINEKLKIKTCPRESGDQKSKMVDMESSGFFEASSKFLPSSKIFLLKIISDYLDCDILKENYVSNLIENNIQKISRIISESAGMYCNTSLLTDDEIKLINKIREKFKLTASQSIELMKIAKQYKIFKRGSLSILKKFQNIKINTKQERKNEFERINKILISE